MSRPKPTVILDHVNRTTYKSEQVLSSEGIWAVFHDNQPINLKTHNILVAYPGPKYKKSIILQSWSCNQPCQETQCTVQD